MSILFINQNIAQGRISSIGDTAREIIGTCNINFANVTFVLYLSTINQITFNNFLVGV